MKSITFKLPNRNKTFRTPIVMGIVNVTPDSFYDGGQFKSTDDILRYIENIHKDGADIIDIGAESTRPGSTPVSDTEQIDRIGEIIKRAKNTTNAILSVDTTSPIVAKHCLNEGAEIINDISGGQSKELLENISKANAGVIIMHKQGSPECMQETSQYNNVVDEVKAFLEKQSQRCIEFNIQTIIVDPGIGFGKTVEHNLSLIKHLKSFESLNAPVLIGTSNKSFIGNIDHSPVDKRLGGSISSCIIGHINGADIFRVHNVQATKQALTIARCLS